MRNRGRGGIGLNPRGRTASSYGIRADDAVDHTNGLVVAVDALQDLASSLRRLEGESLAMEDKKSQTSAGAAGKSSRAANRSAREMMNALRAISVSIGGMNAAYVGEFNETFSGAANQELTETITGSWITSGTIVVVQTKEGPASAYYGSFTMNSESVTAGSFVIRTKNVGAAPAGTYGFKWVAANPT